MNESEHPLALGELLTIDVDAEIRKLSTCQLASEAERCVELVRLSVRLGASAVNVGVDRRAATIVASGARFAEAALGQLAILADASRPAAERHEAFVGLEATYGPGLVSLAAAPWAEVTTDHGGGGSRWTLRTRRRSQMQSRPPAPAAVTFRVGRSGSPGETQRAVAAACAFAGLPIVVNDRRTSRGLHVEDCLLTTRSVVERFEVLVGLPRRGALSRTIVLLNEIVYKDRYRLSRRGFVHAAVVWAAGPLESGDLARVDELVRRLRYELYFELGRRYPSLPAPDQRIARELLLRRAGVGRDPAVLRGVPLFRTLAGRTLDLDAVVRSAREGAVWAVDPKVRAHRFLVDPGRVLVLEGVERDFLANHLGVTPRPPPASGTDASLVRIVAYLRRQRRRAAARLTNLLGRILSSRPLPRSEWTPVEVELIEGLMNEIGSGRFTLPGFAPQLSRCLEVKLVERGNLPLRVRRHSHHLEVRLPRRDPRVTRMLRAFGRDPTSLHAILVALFGGHDGYAELKTRLGRDVTITPGLLPSPPAKSP